MDIVHRPAALAALAVGLTAPAAPALAAELSATTTRGTRIEVLADLPAGPGPFPALVLAPGQGYHKGMPVLEQLARTLVARQVAVYRFDWAYFSRTPRGRPSEDLALELEDMQAVIALARAEPRVAGARIAVGGKSLGSLLAWRALQADPALTAALLLTPVCSRVPAGAAPGTAPVPEAEANYPRFAAEMRPVALIAGDRDPLCAPRVLYGFAATGAGPVRVGIVAGDHGFGRADGGNSITAAVQQAADFIAELPAP